MVGGGALLVSPPQYGVENGWGGVEVDLVAAPQAATAASEPVMQEPAPASLDDPFIESDLEPSPASAAEEAPAKLTPVADAVGDGSSPVPGSDATTLHASSGAVFEAKPKYLRNPAPVYPESARRRGEEGLVVLVADVDTSGKVTELSIKQASGFRALDDSALRTVRRWRFEPASLGGVRLRSRVEVPVRFQLKEK